MAAKRTKKRSQRTSSSPAKVVRITKVRRPVVARKTRIVGRTEPATLARAITEPVVWDVDVERPVAVTREEAPIPIDRARKSRKKSKRAS
jgi:hypothetical protein